MTLADEYADNLLFSLQFKHLLPFSDENQKVSYWVKLHMIQANKYVYLK